MAKIIMEIEDIEGGKVSIKVTPNFETMVKMDLSGNTLTNAHGYALNFINQARIISKSNKPLAIIPLLRGLH